jgi:hypothetical protein
VSLPAVTERPAIPLDEQAAENMQRWAQRVNRIVALFGSPVGLQKLFTLSLDV